MLIDKNGKIGGKINIVDVAAILLVVLVIAGICVRYGSKITEAVHSNEKFECRIRVGAIREYTVEALRKGSIVTDSKAEKVVGTIKSVEAEPARAYATTADGRVKLADYPERYDCYVTIEYTGKESDNSYIMDDGNELAIGRYIEICTKYVRTSGDVKSVKVVE